MFKKNLIANYIGQGWTALMGLAFVPFYIHHLGVEAYGLIGLFVVLQAWLGLLDLGLSPTLNREMARFTGGTHSVQSIRDLLRSIEFLSLSIAILIASSAYLSSSWISTRWIQTENFPKDSVSNAIIIMGLVTALRFLENIYRSSIAGLQRQVLLNVINSILATVRGLGAVAVLAWVSPTIEAFFIWQCFVSIIGLGFFATIAYSCLPRAERTAKFSSSILREVWHFAGGMLGISFLATFLTQIDKILLSKLLSLGEYGYYTLASVVAGALYILVAPITQAIYPRLCEFHVQKNLPAFAEAFHIGAQLVSIFAGSAAIVMIFFAEAFLKIWTHDLILIANVAPLLKLIAIGNLINGLIHMPYQIQLAQGQTRLAIRINIVAVLAIVPTLLWITPNYGAKGAAWVWLGLNVGYFIVSVQFVFLKMLKNEKNAWYVNDVFMPLGAAVLGIGIIKIILPDVENAFLGSLQIIGAVMLGVVSAAMAAPHIRRQIEKNISLVLKRICKANEF